MNKYQKALNNVRRIYRGNHQKDFDMLQELIDKKTSKGIKFLPCTCGRNSHDHIYSNRIVTLVCKGCGKTISGTSERQATLNWNKLIGMEMANGKKG